MPGSHAVVAATTHAFPRHVHRQFGLGLVDRGAQRSHSGRGQVEAGPGCMITVNPGEVHDGEPIGGKARHWRMLYLEPEVIRSAAVDLGAGSSQDYEFVRPVFQHKRAVFGFIRLFEAATAIDEETVSCSEEMLLQLLAYMPGTVKPVEEETPAPIRRAKAWIDDDPLSALPLADLAEECGVSRFQLIRAFQRATGLTPHAYKIQRRLHLARTLIASGISLSEAAVGSGFADQSHMTRNFSRMYGFSPGNFARHAS